MESLRTSVDQHLSELQIGKDGKNQYQGRYRTVDTHLFMGVSKRPAKCQKPHGIAVSDPNWRIHDYDGISVSTRVSRDICQRSVCTDSDESLNVCAERHTICIRYVRKSFSGTTHKRSCPLNITNLPADIRGDIAEHTTSLRSRKRS